MGLRKKGYVLFLAILAMALVAGCTGKEAPTSDKKANVTLNAIFMKQAGYSEDAIKEATDAFTKENPHIKVETTFVPYEVLEQKIVVGNGNYDVMLVDAPWTAKLANVNMLYDVTSKLKDEDRKDIFGGALSAMEYDGKLYGMPWLNDVKYLFYNKEMLEQAGITKVPGTWEEVAAASKTLKEKGIVEYPLVWSWKQAEALICDFTLLTASFGGKFVDGEKVTIDDPANVKALEFMKATMKDGLTNPSSAEYLEEDVRAIFSSGKAAFALNWAYMLGLANEDPRESKVVGKVGIAPIPGTAGAKGATVNGGMGLAISKESKHADEAWQYIQYLSSKEFQKKHTADAPPVWKSLFEDQEAVSANPELLEVSKVQYESIANRAQVPWYGHFSTKLQVSIHEALFDKKSPQEALGELNAAMLEIVQ
ncbi:extracellular solute-binding protein [Paenibacillus sp. NPDC058071]|uniref:extracellular solute-binding protein n=1 Tax=Paenibacillus sp. NPDC058071 TaxID=3346326 RepID=UPI0036DBB109